MHVSWNTTAVVSHGGRTVRIENNPHVVCKAGQGLEVRPQAYLAISIVAPLVLGALGLVLSLPMALVGLVAGAFVPRLYIRSRKMPATTVTQPTKTADE